MNAHRKRWIVPPLACSIAALVANSFSAMAHQSYITSTIGAASGSLLETAIHGQYGFHSQSPWYLYGEMGWAGLPSAPRDNSLRAGAELGYEGMHLGGGFRVSHLSLDASDASTLRTGGYLFYRVLPIAQLWKREVDLSHEDREALLSERIKSRNEKLALAPMIFGEYDQFDTQSAAENEPLRGFRFKLSALWKFSPRLQIAPSYESYVYNSSAQNQAAQRALESRNYRVVQSGPRGPHTRYLGAFGRVSSVMQVHGQWVFTQRESLSASLSRVALANNRAYGSLWVAYHRRPDPRANWVISPGFEHVRSGANHYSFFSLSLSYVPDASYLPPRENNS